MNLYTVEHAPTGDIYRAYQGMDEATVLALNPTSNPFEFISESDYSAIIAALPPPWLRSS